MAIAEEIFRAWLVAGIWFPDQTLSYYLFIDTKTYEHEA